MLAIFEEKTLLNVWRARGIHVCSASSYIIAFLVMLYMLHCSDTVHTYSYCDWTFHALFHLFQCGEIRPLLYSFVKF